MVLSLVLLLARASSAQDIPVRIQDPLRETRTQSEAARATEEARKRLVPGSEEDVTYEQILAAPDDVDLNYRYARSQVKKGNLRGAAASLERVLMMKPDLAKIRLFYAVVLLKAGNLDQAEREFATLQAGKVPDDLRAELDDYLKQLKKRNRKTRVGGVLGAGMDFDDNRNAAAASGYNLLQDIRVPLDSNSTRKSDAGKIMLAGLDLTKDIGQAGHQVAAHAGYYRAEQTNLKIFNLQNYSVGLDGLYKSPWGDLSPAVDFNHLLLSQTTYLRSYSFRLRFARMVGERTDAFAETSYARQAYSRTTVVPNGDQRTGDLYVGTVGAGWAASASQRLSLSYSYVSQGAAAKFDAYRRHAVTVGDTLISGKGRFLLTSVTADFDRYLEPEPGVSSARRDDTLVRAQATYGLPLGFIAKPLEDALWTFSYEYYHALSSVENFSYSSNKISTLLTYKWSVGL